MKIKWELTQERIDYLSARLVERERKGKRDKVIDIPEKDFEELWEQAFGSLQEEKGLYLKRKSQPDFNASDPNITRCAICGGSNVINTDLDIELESRIKSIKSIKIRGAKCSDCGEEYYNLLDAELISVIQEILNNLLPENA